MILNVMKNRGSSLKTKYIHCLPQRLCDSCKQHEKCVLYCLPSNFLKCPSNIYYVPSQDQNRGLRGPNLRLSVRKPKAHHSFKLTATTPPVIHQAYQQTLEYPSCMSILTISRFASVHLNLYNKLLKQDWNSDVGRVCFQYFHSDVNICMCVSPFCLCAFPNLQLQNQGRRS